MAEIVNLRMARKARERAAAQQRAAENRARHSISAADRKKLDQENERARHMHEQNRRDPPVTDLC